MPVKTLGAEWKRFYSDPDAWPDGAYHDDTEITVNGVSAENDLNLDLSAVADDAVLVISGGWVVFKDNDKNCLSLEQHFKNWKKRQTTVFLTVEVAKEKLGVLKAAIVVAGAKIKV